MSIQEFFANEYVGYLFMFGPITAYISVIAYSIYADIDGCRKYVTFKVVKGSSTEFWGPITFMGILMAISPIGWGLIVVLTWHIYKDGPLRPGSCIEIADELKDANDRMQRLEQTCDSLREERMRLNDRCERLEDDVRSYRWHIECLSENRGRSVEPRVSSQVNHKRLIMQIQKEIDEIKRIS